jgi:hypothetical protein
MSWTFLNSYTLGDSSSDGNIIYAYTPSSVYFSTNTGGTFNEILYSSASIPNIKTISTNAAGTKVVMGGTNTMIYEMDTSDYLDTSNPLDIIFSIVNVLGNWSSSCSSDTGDNFIISENPDNPISGIIGDDMTYTKTINGWNLAMTGQKILYICFYKNQNNIGYYNFTSIYQGIYTFEVNGNYNAQEYSGSTGMSWLSICCTLSNSHIYVIGITNSQNNKKDVFVSTDNGVSFTQLSNLSASKNWSFIACSSNGQFISLCEDSSNGHMHISDDFGDNFTHRANIHDWRNTTISNDGQIIYATSIDGLYQSTDGGISCFEENTFILTNDGYKKINTLKINDIVKTTEGYKKIIKIGYNYANSINFKKSVIINSHNPLILSNGHSILLNDLDFVKFSKIVMHPEFYKFSKKINGLNQLLVEDCILFKSLEKNYSLKYYHFVLENDNIEKQYGVYANDILCECMSENFFHRSNLFEV